MMIVYKAGDFREKMKEALNKAILGEDVRIERGGVLFKVVPNLEFLLEVEETKSVFKEEIVKPIKTKEEAVERVKKYEPCGLEYGCGCPKVEGKNLCGKHGRV